MASAPAASPRREGRWPVVVAATGHRPAVSSQPAAAGPAGWPCRLWLACRLAQGRRPTWARRACAAVLGLAVAILDALMGAPDQAGSACRRRCLGLPWPVHLGRLALPVLGHPGARPTPSARRVLEDLEEELVQLRVEQANQEKALTIHENRRKRYSRLQESATAMASSLELEKLAEPGCWPRPASCWPACRLNLTLFVLEGSGKEMLRRSLDLGGGAAFPEDRPLGDDALNAWVLARGTSLVIKDLEKDFRFRGLDMQALKGRSFHLSPLLSTQGQVTGLVRAESIEREAMDQEDGRLLESLVVLASLAFENARLYREAEELAVTDGLTRLMLRRPLMERLDLELKRAGEQGQPMSAGDAGHRPLQAGQRHLWPPRRRRGLAGGRRQG